MIRVLTIAALAGAWCVAMPVASGPQTGGAVRGDADRRYKLAETASFLRYSLGIGRRAGSPAGETL